MAYHANVKCAIHLAASAALLVSVSFASAQQASSSGLVGRWFSLDTSKGGIGEIFELRSDGTIDYSLGAVVDVPWRIQDNQLVLPSATVGGPEQKYKLKWLGDNKLKLEMEGHVTELARAGNRSDAASPIIGEWIESRDMGGHILEARWLFYARGEMLFVMPFAIQHGSYAISGSALQLKIPGLNKPEFGFKLTDGFLTLSDPENDQASHYSRY